MSVASVLAPSPVLWTHQAKEEAPSPRRMVLYARKSQEAEDRQITSLEDQARVLREIADRQELEITEEITEACSAKNGGTRTGFQRLLRILNGSQGPAGVLCWDANRLSRNAIDTGFLIDTIMRRGLRVMTPYRSYGWQELFLMYVDFGQAHYDNEKRSRDVRRGLDSALLRGQWPARAPLGYVNVHTPDGRHHVESDPERFPILQNAFQMYLERGYTVPELLRFVNDTRGFLAPRYRTTGGRPLSVNGIYRIFHNPFYAGLMFMSGRLYPGTHTPMITVEEFETIQARLGTQVARRTARILRQARETAPGPKDGTAGDSAHGDRAIGGTTSPIGPIHSGRGTTRDFALTGLMRCGSCGCAITASRTVNRHGSVYIYYHCTHRIRGCDCAEPHVRA
ncbi:recombinase family protein, partial [Candidatus Uhrbacteria bacterium]|nr:recombinase family protein [Candidatus Uhrbacteria bacterium]